MLMQVMGGGIGHSVHYCAVSEAHWTEEGDLKGMEKKWRCGDYLCWSFKGWYQHDWRTQWRLRKPFKWQWQRISQGKWRTPSWWLWLGLSRKPQVITYELDIIVQEHGYHLVPAGLTKTWVTQINGTIVSAHDIIYENMLYSHWSILHDYQGLQVQYNVDTRLYYSQGNSTYYTRPINSKKTVHWLQHSVSIVHVLFVFLSVIWAS